MILSHLIIPCYIIGTILIFINANKKAGFYITIIGLIINITFLIIYILSDNNSTNYLTLIYFNNVESVVVLAFTVSFIFGIVFVLFQEPINYKELGVIFIYYASAMGVVFAKDLITLFIFWELLALSGAITVAFGNTKDSRATAIKYFTIHILSGVILLIGIIAYAIVYKTVDITNYKLTLENPFNYFILLGVLINLGLPPFSSWIVEGYSKCSNTAVLFLSIYTTKTALYVLFNLFYHVAELVYFGVIISSYAIFYSFIETNVRRLLAYSIMQQLGIIIITIAVSDYVANSFAVSYIAVNIFYKLAIFMVLLIIFKNMDYKSNQLDKLKNSINVNSILGIILIISALQALGLPLTGGFVAKTYISTQISELTSSAISTFIFFATAAVTLNVGIKIPYTLINFKNTGPVLSFKNKLKFLPVLGLLLLLELIFSFNYGSFFNISNIAHSFLVTFIGIIIFIISKIILRGKERKINITLHHFFLKINNTFKTLFFRITSINIISICNNMLINFYNDCYRMLKIKNIYTASNLALNVIIIIIIIYFLLIKMV